jgi:predicted nucleic acid-binding protein
MDAYDADHAACVRLFDENLERLVVPAPVLVELDWLGHGRGVPARETALASIADGTLTVENLTLVDYARVQDLCRQYEDLPLDLVDASVMVVAERLRERKVATLNHRHFTVVRPRHTRALELLPAP